MVRVNAWPSSGAGMGPSRSSKVSASGQSPSGLAERTQNLLMTISQADYVLKGSSAARNRGRHAGAATYAGVGGTLHRVLPLRANTEAARDQPARHPA